MSEPTAYMDERRLGRKLIYEALFERILGISFEEFEELSKDEDLMPKDILTGSGQ